MEFGTFALGALIVTLIISGIATAIREMRTGVDERTPEQKLMDTTTSDRVTRLGSALDAVNSAARGRSPSTRM